MMYGAGCGIKTTILIGKLSPLLDLEEVISCCNIDNSSNNPRHIVWSQSHKTIRYDKNNRIHTNLGRLRRINSGCAGNIRKGLGGVKSLGLGHSWIDFLCVGSGPA
jgi:hypothetical protein